MDRQSDSDRDISEFLTMLRVRLHQGATDYGNSSFERPLAATYMELEQEALDLAGWAFVMWGQLRRRVGRIHDALAAGAGRGDI